MAFNARLPILCTDSMCPSSSDGGQLYNEAMDKTASIPTHIDLYGTVTDSIVDGPGLRFSVFVQGCTHGCPGCHNPDSQPELGGTRASISDLVIEVRANGLIRGVTLSGGEPFEQPEACAQLACQLKQLGYNIWTYTGYLYEDLISFEAKPLGDIAEHALVQRASSPESAQKAVRLLLDNTDVLVDGPFVQSRRSLGLRYRGSSNQRLIDMRATRESGCVTLWSAGGEEGGGARGDACIGNGIGNDEGFPVKPASW